VARWVGFGVWCCVANRCVGDERSAHSAQRCKKQQPHHLPPLPSNQPALHPMRNTPWSPPSQHSSVGRPSPQRASVVVCAAAAVLAALSSSAAGFVSSVVLKLQRISCSSWRCCGSIFAGDGSRSVVARLSDADRNVEEKARAVCMRLRRQCKSIFGLLRWFHETALTRF